MKRITQWISFILFILMISACQHVGLGDLTGTSEEQPQADLKPLDPITLDHSINQAMTAVEMAKRGDLKSLPYVKVESNSNIDMSKQTNLSSFILNSQVIINYSVNQDGIIKLDLFTEFIDGRGRRDLSVNLLEYRAETPDKKEAAAIKAWLMKNRGNFSKSSKDHKEDLVEFQAEKGLKPDGIFGRRSANALSKEFTMIHIKKLESQIFYPEIPNHAACIFPLETMTQNPVEFSDIFTNLPKVAKYSMSLNAFQEQAKPGAKYVLVVLFFDRVDPTRAIQLGFSTTAKRRSEPMSSKQYAIPGKWPALIEPFAIDKEFNSSSLYLNIFMGDTSDSFFKMIKCIGSYRII
jgi:hypothetical protein